MTNQTIHPCPKCEVVPEVDLCYTPTSVVVCCQLHPAYSVDTVLWVDLCDLHLGRACRELGIETVEQLKARLAPDPRAAVLESIREFLALPIAVPAYLSERGRDYYILDVTEYRKQILKLIAAQRGEVEG